MIEFFRDVLDGPLYFIIAIIALIFIMAIIGFIMERKQKEKEARGKVAFVSRENPITQSDKERNAEIPEKSDEVL